MKIKDLIIYPIKSMGGIHLTEANCEEEGLKFDRRMMLVDEQGVFISQRSIPELALISSTITSDGFRFYKENDPDNHIFIPHDAELGHEREVHVWKHSFLAHEVENVSRWFSNVISMKSTLVKMTSRSNRIKKYAKTPGQTLVSMADGYPYLITSDASLDDLNLKLLDSIPMNRFRPNIVLTDLESYAEETLDKIKIGQTNLRITSQCGRCTMITIDQKTTKKLVEPLKTLSTYKKVGNKVMFGMNAVCIKEGIIRIDDIVSKI